MILRSTLIMTILALAVCSARAERVAPEAGKSEIAAKTLVEEPEAGGINIPEPAAGLLAIVGFAWLLRRRT